MHCVWVEVLVCLCSGVHVCVACVCVCVYTTHIIVCVCHQVRTYILYIIVS